MLNLGANFKSVAVCSLSGDWTAPYLLLYLTVCAPSSHSILA